MVLGIPDFGFYGLVNNLGIHDLQHCFLERSFSSCIYYPNHDKSKFLVLVMRNQFNQFDSNALTYCPKV